tara:strand:+ start:179 stop:733 length:555 start_codon:yes stop_codon:yes gene_type:complete
MKKSELTKTIQEEIFEILSEEESADDIKAKAAAQAELNKELEKTKSLTTESLNPEVVKTVDRFIKAMAKRYSYSEQDAVFAIQAALKQREFDKPADIPGFEGTMDALDSLSIREEEEDDMDKQASKAAKKGDSVSKIANKLGETTNQMKKLVKKYKDAEEPEKSKMLARLKELTKIKKELEGLL